MTGQARVLDPGRRKPLSHGRARGVGPTPSAHPLGRPGHTGARAAEVDRSHEPYSVGPRRLLVGAALYARDGSAAGVRERATRRCPAVERRRRRAGRGAPRPRPARGGGRAREPAVASRRGWLGCCRGRRGEAGPRAPGARRRGLDQPARRVGRARRGLRHRHLLRTRCRLGRKAGPRCCRQPESVPASRARQPHRSLRRRPRLRHVQYGAYACVCDWIHWLCI